MGVELRVVRQSSDGAEIIPGKPPLSWIATHRLGGIWDTSLSVFSGDSEDPIVWYVSERQATVILSTDGPSRTLLYSAEGGGKTVTGAMWAIAQVLRLAAAGIFCAGGVTAPTHERLQTVVKAICERVPSDTAAARVVGSWFTYHITERELRCVTGHVLQCRSTRKHSSAVGSPVQGFTWGLDRKSTRLNSSHRL